MIVSTSVPIHYLLLEIYPRLTILISNIIQSPSLLACFVLFREIARQGFSKQVPDLIRAPSLLNDFQFVCVCDENSLMNAMHWSS